MRTTLSRPESSQRFADMLDMRRLFDSFPALFGTGDTIRLEEEREHDNYVVRAEVPGIDPDADAEIWIADRVLHIQIERECEVRAPEGDFRTEFRYGSFHRAIALPQGVDANEVKATYRDGVLEVRLPLRETDRQVSKIEIEKS